MQNMHRKNYLLYLLAIVVILLVIISAPIVMAAVVPPEEPLLNELGHPAVVGFETFDPDNPEHVTGLLCFQCHNVHKGKTDKLFVENYVPEVITTFAPTSAFMPEPDLEPVVEPAPEPEPEVDPAPEPS